MPLPLLAGAALAAIPSIFSGISGMSQAKRGRKLAESNIRPVYRRPGEVDEALALAERSYSNGVMPGSAAIQNQIQAGGAGMLNSATQAATSSSDILDAVTKINYNQGQQFNALGVNEAQYKMQQMQNLQSQLQNSAGYTDKEFAYNKDQPYQDTAAQASALIGAGNQNIGGAVNGLASIGTSIAMSSGAGTDAASKYGYLANKPSSPSIGGLGAPGIASGAFRKMVYDPATQTMKYA